MLNPESLIMSLGGIARGTTVQKYGISRKSLAQAVHAGELRRVRTGVFASPAANAKAVAAAAHGGALTCGSALRSHGVWVLSDSPELHVWMGENGRTHVHRGCDCVSHFFRGRTQFGVATVETALVHLLACQGEEAFFTSFESAWQAGRLGRAARARVRLAIPASARWLVDLARRDAGSGLESLLRLRLHILGIRLDCQIDIDGVGRVDFVIGGRLILETDGKENHDGGKMRHKDLTRDAAASRLGYETLRFDYAQVVHDWPTVQAAIRGALRRLRDHA